MDEISGKMWKILQEEKGIMSRDDHGLKSRGVVRKQNSWIKEGDIANKIERCDSTYDKSFRLCFMLNPNRPICMN